MKFHCLCMSPALDALVRLDRAPTGAGEIFKNLVDEENVGGKAINVARWLAIRGAAVTCGGLLGADNAGPFAQELARYGITDLFTRVAGSTRRNEMIVWPGGATKLNRAAFPALDRWDEVPAFPALEEGDFVILRGSLPPCCAPSFYADCVRVYKARGACVVLDASGEALRLGVAAGPDVVKPNADECAAVVGFTPKTPDGFRRATAILKEHVSYPIISDGGNGCWFDGTFVPSPPVDVVDTTAAGDTLLAEWCFSRDPQRAVAAGSAACTMPGSTPPQLDFGGRK